ncbi:signal peptidase I [Paenibacillus oenotherae]|uniref:Signal peptidase I n=2 Tax=Paenibacillus oenotherae TaxID=1435645 RepID=A0ABS7D035_9BACL|nr:signal peptidase I [Paenibacillus oenotherae]
MSIQTEQQPQKKWVRELRDWGVSLSVAVVAALLIQNYAFAQTEVRNVSMQGTLYEGQRLIEDKITYHFYSPERGEIVIINGPEADKRLIKRVIGLAGDVLDLRDGKVYINDTLLEEPYVRGETLPSSVAFPFTVPADSVFVMGDNRMRSEDSRTIGAIPLTSIEGRAIFRLWPLSKFGQID